MNKFILRDPLDSVEAREIAYQEYSDAHKDIHGIRPTWMAKIFRQGTVEEYKAELDSIWKEYKEYMNAESNKENEDA